MDFRNLKIGTKQMIGFGLILIIMAGVNIFSIKKMATLKSEIDEVSKNWLPRAIALSDLNLNTTNLRLNQLQHAFASDEAQKQTQAEIMIALLDSINKNIDVYEKLKGESERRNLYSEEEKRFYTEFNQVWEEYQDLSFIFFQLSLDNATQEAVDLLNGEAQNVFNNISTILEQLISVNKKDALEASHRAETTYQSTRDITIILLIVTILLSVFITTFLVRYITIPLKHLVQAATIVAGGDLDVHLDITSKDEVGNLAHSFNEMTISLRDAKEKTEHEVKLKAEAAELKIKATEAEARALKAENERKTYEFEQARKLQLSMLPKKLPEVPNLDIAVYIKTATEVGGDYYDFKLGDDDTLTLAIGDATGHGLHAGTVVAATKSLFNALANQSKPVDILKKASQALKEMGFNQIYMAMTLAKIKKEKMILSSAGMPHTLFYRRKTNDVTEIILKGMPLGSFPDYPYKQKECNLDRGDAILFMSDGLTEMFNNHKEILGEDRTKTLFAETAGRSPKQIIEYMVKAGEKWAAGQALEDDITMVVLKVR
jgi:serine phosphatase RsbU (regulator of sigma subunit)